MMHKLLWVVFGRFKDFRLGVGSEGAPFPGFELGHCERDVVDSGDSLEVVS